MHLSTLLIWIISVASILCMLARPRNIKEVWWACGGALLLILCRLIPLHAAGKAILKGTDVYLFLTGMMILSELSRAEGVFDWIADLAGRHADGSPRRLFLLIYLAGVVVTMLLSNDATAVVLTPAVLAIVRKAKVAPRPYLLSCALIANAASFLLPISNPANLVLFARDMPPLGRWLSTFLLPSIASIAITYLCLRLLSRKDLPGRNEAPIADLGPAIDLSREGMLALAGLALAAIALIIASAAGLSLGAPTCIAALIALGVVAIRDRPVLRKVFTGISWAVLPLVAGLFILVEALQPAGMMKLATSGLHALARYPGPLGNLLAAFCVGTLSNGMNNLPVGLITGAAIQSTHPAHSLTSALLLGVDLGPNLSVTGSLATILWLIALRREQQQVSEPVEITAWQFLKVGLIAMPLALAASTLLLLP